MKKTCLPVLIIVAITFVQCRKEKNDQPPPDLAKGLLAYFELNGDFEDSANSFDVTYGGFLNQVKNRHGYANRAMAFNGGLFNFLTPWWRANTITISLWIKPHNLVHNNYLVLSQEGAFAVYQQQSKLGLVIGIPDTASALADIQVEWTHFTGTYDGKDIKTYINGKLINTVRHPGVPDVTRSIIVGAQQPPEWMGIIDDLRFYNRVLTAEEIKLLAGLP